MFLLRRRSAALGICRALVWTAALCTGVLSAQDSTDCLACHGKKDLVTKRDGRLVSMYFDAEQASRSVHAALDCVECHVDLYDVEEFPHAERLQPAECGDCHMEEFESFGAYWKGTHGRLVREGDETAPRCQDCHGGHDILPKSHPRSRAFPLNVPAMCTQCHAEGEEVRRERNLTRSEIAERYKDRIHGSQFFAQGLIVTAVCTSCHGHHGVLPATDPASSIHKDNVNGICANCHGDSPAVHRDIIREDLWQAPGMVPICVDCHMPHTDRSVAYGTNMSDLECLECHAQSDIVQRTGRAALLVDAEQHRASIHGRKLVACAMCHTWVVPSTNRSCATPGDSVDCSVCHQHQVDRYTLGTHGQLHALGDPNAPSCVDCHGSHEIYESSLADSDGAPEWLRRKVLASPTHRRNVPDLCAGCHREGAPAAVRHPGNDVKKVEHYRESIHGKGLLESGLIVSANCVDCHSAHMELPPSVPESTVSPANIVDTCGKCHDGIYETFRHSVHAPGGNPGHLGMNGDDGLPHCNDCHSAHSVNRTDLPEFKTEIVQQCGQCHEDITDTYFATYHGKVSALGDTLAARCHDCHGSHGILSASNPDSQLHPDNIVATCRKCHPGSHEGFTGFLAHATHHDAERYPALYWSFFAMTVLLLAVFGFFGLHLVAWLPRSFALRREHRAKLLQAPAARQKQYVRFNRFNRTLHVMIIVSFLGLTLTGMALKFSETGWAKVLAGLLGGPVTAGWIHRVCAVITFAYMGLHLWDVVRRYRASNASFWKFFFGPGTMIPTWRDVKEFYGTIKWFVGLGPRPKYGKWTYWEKFDYFAVFWGVVVIGFSGLVLWFPELATRVLPGWMINVATIIHSEEALLAAGFIFTIHFFNTHLRPEKFPMDGVVFTGRMTIEELKIDKPRLYEELVASGELESHLVEPPSPTAVRVAKVFGFTALAVGIVTVVLIAHGLLTVGL